MMVKEYQVMDFWGCPPDRDSPRMINLRFVAAAMSSGPGATEVLMNGQASPMLLRIDYDRFVRDWQTVTNP
jgi:hypothetical protein